MSRFARLEDAGGGGASGNLLIQNGSRVRIGLLVTESGQVDNAVELAIAGGRIQQ